MISLSRDTVIADLLRAAQNAHDGADLAREAMNTAAAKELDAKARKLLQEAQAEDPKHEAPAWVERVGLLSEMEKK